MNKTVLFVIFVALLAAVPIGGYLFHSNSNFPKQVVVSPTTAQPSVVTSPTKKPGADLSYLYFVINPSFTLVLTNPNNQKLGNDGINSFNQITNGYFGLSNGITNPVSGKSSGSKYQLSLLTPQAGKYTISVFTTSTTSQNFTLEVSTYDVAGNVTTKNLNGSATNNSPASFSISYPR